MTVTELKKKIDSACRRCVDLKELPLAKVKQMMDADTTPDGMKIYYRLEYNFRVNGGREPYLTILQKMMNEWGCVLRVNPPNVDILSVK
jgi:hypothetical protein